MLPPLSAPMRVSSHGVRMSNSSMSDRAVASMRGRSTAPRRQNGGSPMRLRTRLKLTA